MKTDTLISNVRRIGFAGLLRHISLRRSGRDELPLVRDSRRPLAICATDRELVPPTLTDERELIPTDWRIA